MGLNEKILKLEQRLDATEEAFENLVKAFNGRRDVIADGFDHYDQHMWVLHLMMQDAAQGTLRLWPPHPDDVKMAKSDKKAGYSTKDLLHYVSDYSSEPEAMIDMDWYFQKYKNVRSALDFMQLLHNITFNKESENGTSS